MRYSVVVGLVFSIVVGGDAAPGPFEWWPSIFDNQGGFPTMKPMRPMRMPVMPAMPAMPDLSDMFQSARSGAGEGALAVAELTPTRRHQIAAISPENPIDPNVDISVERTASQPDSGMVGVAARSLVTSVNGKTAKISETVVNDNGELTRRMVTS